jgi:hypothetical protein
MKRRMKKAVSYFLARRWTVQSLDVAQAGQAETPSGQLLALILWRAHLSNCYLCQQCPRCVKKAKISIQSSFRSFEPGHGQRIGFAVRSVVSARDKLAVALRFKNAEDMLSPYILFDRVCMSFCRSKRLVDGLHCSRDLRC